MSHQGGAWGWVGESGRALELPGGSHCDVAPPGRARLRYDESVDALQLSRDGGAYENLQVGSGGSERLAYGTMPLVWPWANYPLTAGALNGRALGNGGEELYENFDLYTRSRWRIVVGDGQVYDPLSFSTLAEVVAWVNDNVPNNGGNFTAGARLFCYDAVDESIHPLSIVFGRNANMARLKSRYWSPGVQNAVTERPWSDEGGDEALNELWTELFGAPLAALPWTDNERRCFWLSRNMKRLYDMPNRSALAAAPIPGSGNRHMQQYESGDRVPAGGAGFSWSDSATEFAYVVVSPAGAYQERLDAWSAMSQIPRCLSTGASILAGIPLESSLGDRAVLVKPVGIDQVYFEYVDQSLYRLEFVAGSDRDLTRRMRVLSPEFSTPGQYTGPCTIDQWWDAVSRATTSYHGHGPGLGTGAFQLRDLSTNRVSALSAAQVKWLRRYRGRPLACVVGNKP